MRTRLKPYIFILLSARFGIAQISPPTQPQVTPPARYETFLRNLAVISAKSDALDAAGVKNHKLKQGVCDSLSVSAADCNLLFQIAVATNLRLSVLDQQAKAIIDNVREQYPHGAIPAGKTVPPPPAALGQLQAQREALVSSAATAVQQQLSTTGTAALTNRLNKTQNASKAKAEKQ